MRKSLRTKVFVILGLVALMMVRPLQHFRLSPHEKGLTNLSITAESGVVNLKVEVADTNDKRILGLMYRKSLEPNKGMFFVFNEEGPRSFWMKNTFLSLDILFINAQREVVFIVPNTIPFSEESIPSPIPAQYVLELNAGMTAQKGIKVGDRINF